ncbi:Smr/MutS family protein [Dongia rigui]|uniref:Smr/MutS family protein n=1 Tax=Dongia rigui TaxID=940149 RepID=A0ABU5DZB3_9PROT|nr:Smr/MutS family protein [Dongia rigui]MDY0871968.1 Smr/MutS family protein [Dongia rigui]
MAGKRRLTEQELALWQAVATTVTPLKPKRQKKAALKAEAVAETKPAGPQPPAKRPKSPPKGPPPAPKPVATAAPKLPPLTPYPAPGTMPGIDKRQSERFRRGQLAIEGKIDLHGRTQTEAHDALLHFLERAFKHGKRQLLVITGKGMTQSKSGILKANVPRWLNEPVFRRLVLAISQARPEHGGEGALYVLLKRQK